MPLLVRMVVDQYVFVRPVWIHSVRDLCVAVLIESARVADCEWPVEQGAFERPPGTVGDYQQAT